MVEDNTLNMENYSSYLGSASGFADQYGIVAVIAVLVWSLAWKGWALWLAARRNESIWFIALLLINTLGVLEIIYIFAIAKRSDQKSPTIAPASTV